MLQYLNVTLLLLQHVWMQLHTHVRTHTYTHIYVHTRTHTHTKYDCNTLLHQLQVSLHLQVVKSNFAIIPMLYSHVTRLYARRGIFSVKPIKYTLLSIHDYSKIIYVFLYIYDSWLLAYKQVVCLFFTSSFSKHPSHPYDGLHPLHPAMDYILRLL